MMESRALDYCYDPVFTDPRTRTGGLKRHKAVARVVSGQERYKYFRRPIVPRLDALPAEVILAPTLENDPLVPPPVAEEAPTRECSVQTDYRESEAQTDPYTPPYRLRDGDPDPELLLLQGLKHDKGLDRVTLLEVQMIEYKRRKRSTEASLPPATDEASLQLRRRIFQNLELQGFRIREREIDRNRNARLEVLQQLLHDRDQALQFSAQQRVEATRQDQLAKRDAAIERIQTQRLQVLRKLSKERAAYHLPGSSRARDIVEEYSQPSSKVHAPVVRDGQVGVQHLPRWVDQSTGAPLVKLQLLQQLESSLPEKIARPVDIVHPGTGRVRSKSASRTRREARADDEETLAHDLELMDSILRSQRLEQGQGQAQGVASASREAVTRSAPASPGRSGLASPGGSCKAVKKMVERPPTPRVPDVTVEEEVDPHVLLLQRLLRGRAVQNLMFEGKERRKELIKEIRIQQRATEESQHDSEEQSVRRDRIAASSMHAITGALVSAFLDVRASMRQHDETPVQEASQS